jgi:hypothetical protein
MSITRDLGNRVELVPMDSQFHNITIALYRQDHEGRAEYRVHSYSRLEGAPERIRSVRQTMTILGQLEQAGEQLYFACASAHQAAMRRTFLEAAKLPTGIPAVPKPLTVTDKKSGRSITAVSLGNGRYQISADGPNEGKGARIDNIVSGLVKLLEVEAAEGNPGQVAFPCGQSHDALTGLLLPRALNVRAILREEEAAGGRGLLVAPSQQK